MPIVQAKCTNCGGILAVDDAQEAAVCPFCNTPYIVEKAVQQYHITNNVTAMAGAVVNVYGTADGDFVIEAGVLKEYRGAAADIVIPDTVKRIGKKAFLSSAITSVVIPDSVTEIEEYAFCKCEELTAVNIPDSVKIIHDYAFNQCTQLAAVNIPDGVERIGRSVFYNTALYNNASNWHNGALYIGRHLIYVQDEYVGDFTVRPDTLTLAAYAFYCCEELTGVTLPPGLKRIEAYTFFSCKKLQTVSVPQGVTYIGKSAFSCCDALKSVELPDSVTQMGSDAFYSCGELVDVTLPEHDVIGVEEAFNACHKLNGTQPPDNKKAGCYIATAVYGTYDCPQVWTLRRWRDTTLAETGWGRAFIRTYYAVSPTLVKRYGNNPLFRYFWRKQLDKKVRRLNESGVADTPYKDK